MPNAFVSLPLAALSVSLACGLAIGPMPADHGRSAPASPPLPERVSAPAAVGRPTFASPHANPVAVVGGRVFVCNTPADTVDVLDADTREVVARVPVGIDPVGLAVRPDGGEVWISNHVSDSVSVIDVRPGSLTYLHVVATVQDLDPVTRATAFDEPVGIAFASDDKAYVALSSTNRVAVVNVADRRVVDHLEIPAQDPRALAVRNGRLYVAPFESGNRTQLSGGSADAIDADDDDGDLVTFDAWEHSIVHNNVLSLGHVVDIVKRPDVPDRDLFVFDVTTDEPVATVDSLGTLLYGLAVDSRGRAFLAQTDARNDANGRAGTKKHGLAELGNRAFLNQITRVNVEGGEPTFFDLEPPPPVDPEPGAALATPYAVAVTADDRTVVATAAGSDTLFTVNAETGTVLGRATVGAVPRGVVLEETGDACRAWVLNAVENSVSLVDLSDPAAPKPVQTIPLTDPTDPAIKRGRIAFESASSSRTNTFSCASCHPDGHTDQLLWVLNTPVVSGGDQIMPRSTMPLRGLRDTEPFHWDGIPGDPYGGTNSASVHRSVDPNIAPGDALAAVRHLIDGSLSGTMARVGDEGANDAGLAGNLTEAERDDLAVFLAAVPYPPAPERAYTDELSDRARRGFELFHVEGNIELDEPRPNVCGDCHRLPFLTSTNTPGTGMDAPTWRGAYDRPLILPQGRLNLVEFPFFRSLAERGVPERELWRLSWRGNERFDPIWDMVMQMSTGFSGAFGRQVTLNRDTAGDDLAADLLDAIERAADDGAVVLTCEGVRIGEDAGTPVRLRFDPAAEAYAGADGTFTREELAAAAADGVFVGTFTGRHGAKVDANAPQPALWTLGPLHEQRGRQEFPVLDPISEEEGRTAMTLSARHVESDAFLLVNGRRAEGALSFGEGETLTVALDDLQPPGTHFLQVQNPGGRSSNEFLFTVADPAAARPEEPAADAPSETLGELLKETGFDRLIGAWVDRESGGEDYRTTFRWAIEDCVLEQTSDERGKKSMGLLSLRGGAREVGWFSADAAGTATLGGVAFEGGQAVHRLGYRDGEGREGALIIRYRFETDDRLTMRVFVPGGDAPVAVVPLKRTKPL
ncbi:hypothetical protein [Alienimonas chondri]|uniref:Cytochrome c domain-containing protein n=1 Tax=Alienimonas chondri TaxID=2681879 RepID=A0ABX1VBL6_9PLAN|nr:hypothetical protein [Alienimonas chondri]NNJ24890.1 hypothetical protein [Alienimonas chondri]